MSTATASTGLRRTAEFGAGLALVVGAGWMLLYAGYKLAHWMNWGESYGIALAAVASLALFVVLERDFWLSGLLGLRHKPNASWVPSAVLMWLFGVGWLFVKGSLLDADRPEEDADRKKAALVPRDHAREAVETVVFVVVLVLLLKLFVTEAFVIPTGSMAETLYGYQKIVTCPKCDHEFPVNSHDEVEPNQVTGIKHPLVAFTCPNCRYHGRIESLSPRPDNRTGDRVLVLKPIYHLTDPRRGDVVVFKYPDEPQQKHTAQNYIKRAMGFGGETIAIFRGELFVTRSIEYPPDAKDTYGDPLYPRPDDPKDWWKPRYMYADNRRAVDLFDTSRKAGFPVGLGGFEIVRKGEEQLLADLRLVWDNDKQPAELSGKVPPRWYAPPESQGNWSGDNPHQPRAFAHTAGELDWLRYRHLAWSEVPIAVPARDPLTGDPVIDPITHEPKVEYRTEILPWVWEGNRTFPPYARQIDNFLGYNAGVSVNPSTKMESGRGDSSESSWVGDLILECEVETGDGAAVVLELSKGINRFQATFADGTVTLSSTGPGGREFGSRPTRAGRAGKHTLRFANVDYRLRVWVDGQLIDFGTDADHQPTEPGPGDAADAEGWTKRNDVDAPAGIGAKGRVTVRSIKLHRDVYYTGSTAKADLFYVQPGHTLCLGDNSAQSSDSRKWGTVPDRLMLGKAVFVFWPASIYSGKNRAGFIK